ncbi:MAG: porin [Alphaproteobacteria bacterium]|nr:porin [Alphaproteobacteria bacterium]
MKKTPFLLLCCALSTPAVAGTWETDYSLFLNNYYGYTDYASPYNRLHKQNNLNSSVNFYGQTSYFFNQDYSASLVGYFMVDSAKKIENYNQGVWGEEVFALADSPYGQISVGQNYNVAYAFAVGAPNIGAYHINNTELTNFITNPNWYKKGHKASYKTLNSTYINTDGASLKASYITPTYKGIKLGATYVPETYSESGLVAKDSPYKDKSAYVLGAYGGWDILGYELETSLGFADFDKNDKEYSAGFSLYRKGWTLGASYRKTKTSKSDYALNKENLFDAYREGRAYNIGLSYAIGPYTAGIAYFDSKAENFANHDKIISFSNTFQYNKYVAFSLTAAHLESKGENNDLKNTSKGYAFIVGLELSLW